MAYDDSRYRGDSYSPEPEFRPVDGAAGADPNGYASAYGYGPNGYDASGYDASGYAASEYAASEYAASEYAASGYAASEYAVGDDTRAPVAASQHTGSQHTGSQHTGSQHTGSQHAVRPPTGSQHLADVFDDPRHGDFGRDRFAVHLAWEAVLLVAMAAAAYLLYDSAPNELRGAGLKSMLVFAAVVGFAALGAGLTLRAAAPNLAIGPMVYACAQYFAAHSSRGLLATALLTAVVALGVGVVLAVVVVGLHVPAWAASLGVGLAVMAWIGERTDVVTVVAGAYQPATHAFYWYGAFAVIALSGAGLGLVAGVRRNLGRYRPAADPSLRRGFVPALTTSLALIGSTGLAAVSGVLLALSLGRVDPSENGLTMTGLALGAALLAGTSAFGRRGGLFGTVLAVTLVVLALRYDDTQTAKLHPLGVAAAAIGIGLLMSRLVERFGQPSPYGEPPLSAGHWTSTTTPPSSDSSADSGWGSQSGGWASPLPARTTEQGWGQAERWPGR